MHLFAPNGSQIVGTLERITGRANATSYSETGEPEYDGETEVWWDEQETATNAAGQTIYVDEDGYQWTFDELTAAPEEDDEEGDDE